MTLIKKFRLFRESTTPSASFVPSMQLEFTHQVFPLLGKKFERNIDPDAFFGDEDGEFLGDDYRRDLIEKINEFLAIDVTEHLTSLGVGIHDVKAMEIGGRGNNELYFDLHMEEDWLETLVEHIQSIRPAHLDAFLSARYQDRPGFYSFMPQSKIDLLKYLENEEKLENGVGAALTYLLGDKQLKRWGKDALDYLRDNLHLSDYFTEMGEEYDDEEDDESAI